MKDGWTPATIGDYCEVIAGQSPASSAYNSQGRGKPFYQGKKDFTDRFISQPTVWTTDVTKIARAGDILMSVRAPVGPVNFATQEVCIGRGLAAIRSNQSLDRDFLYYQLLYSQPVISGKEGAVFASINKADIAALPIVVPPIAEQRRTVTILDQAFKAIETAKANSEKSEENAKELFDSYLGGVFARADKGWVSGKLVSFCREITVGHVGSMAKRYVGSGIPFLRSQNIRPFDVSLRNVVYIDDAFDAALSKSKLAPNDVAIVRTGYPGTAAVIPESLERANCADLVIVRPKPCLNPHFLAAFFNSSYGKSLVGGKLVGAAQKHFNVTAAKEATLHVPPLEQQNEIVEQIAVIRAEAERLATLYNQKISALDVLRESTMKQAFNGNL